MTPEQRKTYHEVLDKVLDQLTDGELGDGIVDLEVRRSTTEGGDKVNKIGVSAMCTPYDGGIVIEDLVKWTEYVYLDEPGMSIRNDEIPLIKPLTEYVR